MLIGPNVQVLLIGFSADIGRALGDTKENCSVSTGPRWAAAAVYIVGFWFLDFANNTVQGPARAMMADLSGERSTQLKLRLPSMSMFLVIYTDQSSIARVQLGTMVPTSARQSSACGWPSATSSATRPAPTGNGTSKFFSSLFPMEWRVDGPTD